MILAVWQDPATAPARGRADRGLDTTRTMDSASAAEPDEQHRVRAVRVERAPLG